MDGPTTVLTVGGNPNIANKSIVREKLNSQIHALYTRKVQFCLFIFSFFKIIF
jgi:hypothetical protein